MKSLIKLLALAAVFWLLQLSLNMIGVVLQERTFYRSSALGSVARMQGGAQTLLGPLVQVPVHKIYWVEEKTEKDVLLKVRKEQNFSLYFFAKELQVEQQLKAEVRQRGIFDVPLFVNAITLSGSLHWPANYGVSIPADEQWQFGQPTLSLSVSAQQGIAALSALNWQLPESVADKFRFRPGSQLTLYDGQGVHAELPISITGGEASFSLELKLTGSNAMAIVPSGEQNVLSMHANWPHPQFIGARLPERRELSDHAFNATWLSNTLATNIQSALEQCLHAGQNSCAQAENDALGFSLYEPVDLYSQTERALKYGFLFTGLSLAAVWLCEILCGLSIHAFRYALSGFALVIFYLLLLSLAEHIGFALAYLIAAGACIGLLSAYAHSMLMMWRRSLCFSGFLVALYGALFMILQMEDLALLSGSILLFVLLAIGMWLTRNVDWYQLQTQIKNKTGASTRMNDLVDDIKL